MRHRQPAVQQAPLRRSHSAWEQARDLAGDFAQPRRNLGLAYFNQHADAASAWKSLEQAFQLNKDDARVLYELEQLAKALNHDAEEHSIVCKLIRFAFAVATT